MKFYESPRWSNEILDCSMPLTFDTYNKCSFNCLYCFSFFQKSKSTGVTNYHRDLDLTWVDIAKIRRIWACDETLPSKCHQFFPYIRQRLTMQWGGLADQFDHHERKHGITLELLKFFKSIDYPLCFSTKAAWWTEDERYVELFRGQKNWNVKVSIINMDAARARGMEPGVPSPEDRLKAIERIAGWNAGGATLRLRPFIVGHTDRNGEYLTLINRAADAGATAVTTEFLCLEMRTNEAMKDRYRDMDMIVGFDLMKAYRACSSGSGYLRFSRAAKRPFIDAMEAECARRGLRFYVSDAHFKERCANGSCCGLGREWAYQRGQFTEALMIAKTRGEVRFSDIAPHLEMYKAFGWEKTAGYNTNSSLARVVRGKQSMYDYIRERWNNTASAVSPYRYFGGVLKPAGLDDNGDVIYQWVGEPPRAAEVKSPPRP